MPKTSELKITELKLDLANFRTVPQKSEKAAIRAIILANPSWFWALMESLLDEDYHMTENILVLQNKAGTTHTVKEGNRRVGALKLVHGYISRKELDVPDNIEEKIANLDPEWKTRNTTVPCAIYSAEEHEAVDRIVSLTHGKGEKAGRDKWNAIATARHARDKSGKNQPALDLLEKYLISGRNITPQQKERWGGLYPLTVLDEAVKRLATRMDTKSAQDYVKEYPAKIKHRDAVENILHDIGAELLTFPEIRDKSSDFAELRGFSPLVETNTTTTTKTTTSKNSDKTNTSSQTTKATTTSTNSNNTAATSKRKAVAINTSTAVKRQLTAFSIVGEGRGKIIVLRDEMRKLKLKDHPHAFCFLLRSMFEISAKAYCADHAKSDGPKSKQKNGQDRPLAEMLRDIVTHLSDKRRKKDVLKRLIGAETVLTSKNQIFSVESMNQLVHNPSFSVDETHICTMFSQVYPLLEAMNE